MQNFILIPQLEFEEKKIPGTLNHIAVWWTIKELYSRDILPKALENNVIWFKVDYSKMVDQLPRVGVGKSGMRKIIDSLVETCLLIRYPKNKGRTGAWFTWGEKHTTIGGKISKKDQASAGFLAQQVSPNSDTVSPNSDTKLAPNGSPVSPKTGLLFDDTPIESNNRIDNQVKHESKREIFPEETTSNESSFSGKTDTVRSKNLQRANDVLRNWGLTQAQINKIFQHCSDTQIYNEMCNIKEYADAGKVQCLAKYTVRIFKIKYYPD